MKKIQITILITHTYLHTHNTTIFTAHIHHVMVSKFMKLLIKTNSGEKN